MTKVCSDGVKCSQESGFTLLELLVVLVLIGAVSSYVGPGLWKTYAKNQERSVVQEFASSVQHLRNVSRRKGMVIRLPAIKNGVYSIEGLYALPSGWDIKKAPQMVLLPTGVTNGGNIVIRSDSGSLWDLRFKPLDGRVEIERQ